jgi:hypothetical protein
VGVWLGPAVRVVVGPEVGVTVEVAVEVAVGVCVTVGGRVGEEGSVAVTVASQPAAVNSQPARHSTAREVRRDRRMVRELFLLILH